MTEKEKELLVDIYTHKGKCANITKGGCSKKTHYHLCFHEKTGISCAKCPIGKELIKRRGNNFCDSYEAYEISLELLREHAPDLLAEILL